jgi:hypothetical protein
LGGDTSLRQKAGGSGRANGGKKLAQAFRRIITKSQTKKLALTNYHNCAMPISQRPAVLLTST